MSQRRRAARGPDLYLDVWHRQEHLAQYLGPRRAGLVHLIDIDCCEYCNLCSEPVALIETKDIRAASKSGKVTAKLASRALLPAWLVEYTVADDAIEGFRVTPWHPVGQAPRDLTPGEFADWLWDLRTDHWRDECRDPSAGRMLSYGRD
jgi:hypothetical protein